MKIFYISDLHIGHQKVLEFDNRPFETLDEMHEVIRNNWNNVVGKEDVVYLLGDILWKHTQENFDYIKSLNGRKRLIKGNHDRSHNANYKNLFEAIYDYEQIKDGNRNVVLCHYPIPMFNGHQHGAYMVHGHVHSTKEHTMNEVFKNMIIGTDIQCNMYNCGCMLPYMNYTPRTLDEIIESNSNK